MMPRKTAAVILVPLLPAMGLAGCVGDGSTDSTGKPTPTTRPDA